MVLAYILGIGAGLSATLQGSVNGRVRSNVRSPYITSLLNFMMSLSLMIIIVLAVEHSLDLHWELIAKEPAWILTGGLCGTVVVTVGAVSIPVIGNALNMMLVCFGQIMTGLLIDHFGLFGAPMIAMSGRRTAGALLAFAGIVLLSYGEGLKGLRVSKREMTYIVMSAASGFAAAVQVAVNGTLGEVIDSSVRASLISMAGGLISIIVIILLIMIFGGPMAIFSTADGQSVTRDELKDIRFHWLMLCGGPLAIGVVLGNAIAAPVLGTGIVTITNLIGMMASSLAVDAVGFLGLVKKPVTARKLAGMALMAAATVLISLV